MLNFLFFSFPHNAAALFRRRVESALVVSVLVLVDDTCLHLNASFYRDDAFHSNVDIGVCVVWWRRWSDSSELQKSTENIFRCLNWSSDPHWKVEILKLLFFFDEIFRLLWKHIKRNGFEDINGLIDVITACTLILMFVANFCNVIIFSHSLSLSSFSLHCVQLFFFRFLLVCMTWRENKNSYQFAVEIFFVC